jgi:tetratricopeptide (TPR) repeat protein
MRANHYRIAAAVLLLAAIAAGEAAPANIIKEGGTVIKDAWIVSETVDGADYLLDKKGQATSSIKRANYVRIDYTRTDDPFFDSGLNELARGNNARAIEQFTRVVGGTKYDWVAETAAIRLAEALIQAKKPTEAVAAIEALEKKSPKSPRLIEGQYLKGRAQGMSGNEAGARATFAAIAKRTDGGRMAVAWSARGLAEMLRAQGKRADAAAALEPALKPLHPVDDAREWGAIAIEMAEDFAAAGDAKAVDWFTRIAWSAAAGPERCRALLGRAKLNAAKGDSASRLAAFDDACLAVWGVEDPGAARGEARNLVKSLFAAIEKDASVSDADKREYRTYLSKP